MQEVMAKGNIAVKDIAPIMMMTTLLSKIILAENIIAATLALLSAPASDVRLDHDRVLQSPVFSVNIVLMFR